MNFSYNAPALYQINSPNTMQMTRDMFISGPYLYCPICNRKKFGVWPVGNGSNSFLKECTNCGHQESIQLPKIKKHIIYLDQFVFDGMVKVLDKDHPKHERVLKEHPYWLDLYKKLCIAHRAQLIVCPDSFFHQEESSYSSYFSSLKRVYEYFSTGITFQQDSYIRQIQICEHFNNYLGGKSDKEPSTNADDIVLRGDLHRWNPLIDVSIDYKLPDDIIARAKEDKAIRYADFLSVCKRWKQEKGRKINEWYSEEVAGYIKSIYLGIGARWRKLEEAQNDPTILSLDDIFPTSGEELFEAMFSVATKHGMDGGIEIYNCIKEYLSEKELDHIPAIRIRGLLFAGLADLEANGGRLKPASEGVFTDVNMISSLLPYCDAIFVDIENWNLLKHGHIAPKLRVKTKIYSKRTLDSFMVYLDDIISSITPSHRNFLEKYYGKDWNKPYLEILNGESK